MGRRDKDLLPYQSRTPTHNTIVQVQFAGNSIRTMSARRVQYNQLFGSSLAQGLRTVQECGVMGSLCGSAKSSLESSTWRASPLFFFFLPHLLQSVWFQEKIFCLAFQWNALRCRCRLWAALLTAALRFNIFSWRGFQSIDRLKKRTSPLAVESSSSSLLHPIEFLHLLRLIEREKGFGDDDI